MKMLNQCLESLVQKVQSGVVLNFEKVGPEPPIAANEGKEVKSYDGRKHEIWGHFTFGRKLLNQKCSLPYHTSQLHAAILHRLLDWRDTFKLTDLELPLLPPLLTTQYLVFLGPSG